MAKTLRGAPIVGYYKQEKEDFVDHGEEITIDHDGVHFKNKTRPYGFVAPDAKVWFKDFEDTDDLGNTTVRTYLMTTGYLWTGQYEQAKKVFEDEGKPHSMELEKNLKGHWATNSKNNIEFFIINDAIFSKLCILGDEVEPCFEGSGVTPPDISAAFSLDNDFKHTLFTMMEELKYALEGGNAMTKPNETVDSIQTEEVQVEFTENKAEVSGNESSSSEQVPSTDFKKEDDEDKKEKEDSPKNDEKKDESDESKGGNEEKKPSADGEGGAADKEDDEDKKKKKFTVSEEQYQELQSKYSALEKQAEELRAFKKKI